MAILLVCEEHPRRTKGILTFTYIDADGIEYESHWCAECAELEIEEGLYDWIRVHGGYRFEQPLVSAS